MWAIWFKKFGGWFIALFSAIVAVLAFVFAVRSKAKSDAAIKYTNEKAADREALAVRNVNEEREAIAKQAETFEGVQNVQTEISHSDDAAIQRKLRDEWSRD